MENFQMKVEGFVEITDKDTGEILVSKKNAIHYENMSIALADTLSNRGYGSIFTMVFGNGASQVDGIGNVLYLPPNTTGSSADLYTPTYSKVIDDTSSLDLDPTNNYMSVSHTTNNLYSDLKIVVTLAYGEPSGQGVIDNASTTQTEYVFNELGLKSKVSGSDTPLLLTHLVFHPIQKSLNRTIVVNYTIRISFA